MKKNQKSKKIKVILKFFLLLIMLGVSFNLGMYATYQNALVQEVAQKEFSYLGEIINKEKTHNKNDLDFKLYWDVWNAIKTYYVDKEDIKEKELFYGSLRGMASALQDPYTVFMDPKISNDFSEGMSGRFEGIGAEIGIRDDILTVIAPLDDMPAQIAGLHAGDQIHAIDGTSTIGITIDEAVNRIRGPKDTQVTLSIFRKGADEIQDIVITRGVIVVKSLKTEMREDDIFILKISHFNDDTYKLFAQAVTEIRSLNPRGIILDLRNNPGGYLETAIVIASEWIEDGVIVAEQFSDGSKIENMARGKADLANYKTVVLVNQGSASASEIVAGALQDYNKATVIGAKTFGKGSVQTLKNFFDGSALKVTISKWLTPLGKCIKDEGIMPDEEVELDIEEYKNGNDNQLNRAIEILNEQEGAQL